jgi:RHS repeat-associated protein
VFFGGLRVARIDSGGNAYYYFSDRLGSARAITNSSGTTCYNADFTPFGTELAFTNTCPQNYKFTGYERDAETGTDHAIYRQYSSSLGRFMQPDPLPGTVSKPQSLNRYAYVLNDPLNWTDRLGLSPCPAGTHPANPNEITKQIGDILSLNATYAAGDHLPTSIDCSWFVMEVVNAAADPDVPWQSAQSIWDGNSATYILDDQGPSVGDVVAWQMDNGYHVGIVTNTAPFTFAASNSPNKRHPNGGPASGQNMLRKDGTPAPAEFFTICIKDKAKPTPAATSSSGGDGGGGGYLLNDSFAPTVVDPDPLPEGTVTIVETIGSPQQEQVTSTILPPDASCNDSGCTGDEGYDPNSGGCYVNCPDSGTTGDTGNSGGSECDEGCGGGGGGGGTDGGGDVGSMDDSDDVLLLVPFGQPSTPSCDGSSLLRWSNGLPGKPCSKIDLTFRDATSCGLVNRSVSIEASIVGRIPKTAGDL